METPTPSSTAQSENVQRARDLFGFLEALQRTKREPARLASAYARQNDGKVIWVHTIPEDSAIAWFPQRADGVSRLVSVDRPSDVEPPTPPASLADQMTDWHDSGRQPLLAAEVDGSAQEAFEAWLQTWTQWAQADLAQHAVRDFYKDLYETRLVATNKSEEYELVAGLGCLSWQSPDGEPIQRHTLTVPIKIGVDDRTGQLAVDLDETSQPVNLELEEFIDPTQIMDPGLLSTLKADITDFEGSPLDREAIQAFLQRLATMIDYACDFDKSMHQAPPSARPRLVWAPALIVRQRSSSGLMRVFQTISERIETTGAVPPGLLPLIDPNRLPPVEPDDTPGALYRVGDEAFLPLPLNGRQLDVISRLERHAQVVVQGPPGTGKTHTIAALLSHLLAQGKRILVTAHTDRALDEVRNKLPEAIKPLSVSVIGTSRDDMADLKVAVETIATRSEQHDADRLARALGDQEGRLARLAQERSDALRQVVDARATEVQRWEVAGESGTMAELARFVAEHAGELSWITTLMEPAEGPCPLDSAHLMEYRNLLLDPVLDQDRDAAGQQLIDSGLPTPAEFAALCHAATEAARHAERLATPGVQRWTGVVDDWADAVRESLHTVLDDLLHTYDETRDLPHDWVPQAVAEVTRGGSHQWTERFAALTAAEQVARQLIDDVLGAMTEVRVHGDPAALEPLARNLAAHVADAGDLSTRPDGQPVIRLWTNKRVKAAVPVFQQVQVDGLPPTTASSLDKLLGHFQLERYLRGLDQEWHGWVMPLGPELPSARRLRWHRDAIEVLRRVTSFATKLAEADALLRQHGVRITWTDMAAPEELFDAISAAPAMAAAAAATQSFQDLDDRLSALAAGINPSPVITSALDAVRARDPQHYRDALDRNNHLVEVAARLRRRETLADQLRRAGLGLVLALEHSAGDDTWNQRFVTLDRAWRWLQVDSWLSRSREVDPGVMQKRVSVIEDQITQVVAQLSADRAWSHALSPERIDQRTRHDLQTYVQQVRRLGKGTGKNADHVRAEIRKAMNRSRGAVPVWIMPLYRIAEQLTPEENLFDVVIVDEASQASVEAVFLQYFAPKIVVVGDDKQVSPAGVGIETQMLRDLADLHMPSDPYRHTSWDDPGRSLFDEARARYGGVITLTEHRRCVPEIIGFSNEIAYKPEGAELVPVRQVGSDRLPPIRTVFVADGYRTRRNVNTPEALAIADQMVRCIADPAYAGMTMGVISLLGAEQARTIRDILLERIPVKQWTDRDILVGDASSFQGSERNVIFLSMVATVEPDHRAAPLTADRYRQRFNVAASRAQDQMWLFHSVELNQLRNEQDMRHQLLRYCQDEVAQARTVSKRPELAVEDIRQEPFASLFEQRVHNELVRAGFDVRPKVEVLNYRLDLVVHGGSRNLALECDGDRWEGPDVFANDLARQRELERCGWVFHRVRESAFVRNPPAEIARLSEALAERGISPVDWDAPTPAPVGSATVVVGAPEPTAPGDAPESTDRFVEVDQDPDDESDVTVQKQEVIDAPEAADRPRSYREFAGPVPPLDSPPHQVAEGIAAIVAVEGPMTESRLAGVYARAAGVRLGRLIRASIHKGLQQATRRGLVEATTIGQGTDRIFRLPEQPEVLVRDRGPRTLETIPINEIAAVVAQCRSTVGDPHDEETVFREVMAHYGLIRLTESVRNTLRAATRVHPSSV